jgi:polysaccharide biosynthesis/export protein
VRGIVVRNPLSQFCLFLAVLGLTCCPLWSQSNTGPESEMVTPALSPVAPIGTSFNASTGALQPNQGTTLPNLGAGYKIGADDVLTINVWHEPEVSRNVPVRPDGKISLPLVGDVAAAGLTPVQLQNELEARFAKYLTNPDVSVIVAEIRSQRINVLGQVLRPGTYPLIPPMTAIDAIAAAGGLREFAKANKAYVLRTLPNGQRERIKFQYKNVLKGKRGSNDVVLQTRDTVVVP